MHILILFWLTYFFFCFQRCKFQVGSYSYDDTKMIFLESPRVKGYVETSRSIVLDYEVVIKPLKESDRVLSYGSLGNYSLAGFEMILHRYVSHYIITYYLPSGKSLFLDHFKRLSLTQSSRKLLGIRNGRSCESGAISEIPNFVFSTWAQGLHYKTQCILNLHLERPVLLVQSNIPSVV